MLSVTNLDVAVNGGMILNGLNLEVQAGEVHAIMGPNGSGKSTFANVLAGHPGYEVTAGSVIYEGQDLLQMEPEERARQGVFLAFQYPVEIPGVSNVYMLKAAVNAIRKHRGEDELDAIDFLKMVRQKLKLVEMKEELLHRPVNEGFSGGEKKRACHNEASSIKHRRNIIKPFCRMPCCIAKKSCRSDHPQSRD